MSGKALSIDVVIKRESQRVSPEELMKEIKMFEYINSFSSTTTSELYFVKMIDVTYINGRPSYFVQGRFGDPLSIFFQVKNDVAGVMFLQMVKALNYLHSLNIAHLDIKPENILAAVDKHGAVSLKLCDFDSAVVLTRPNNNTVSVCEYRTEYFPHEGLSLKISQPWVAPEVYKVKFEGGGTLKAAFVMDVFSLGLVAAILFKGI
jgi:serine/threonine protein kinase